MSIKGIAPTLWHIDSTSVPVNAIHALNVNPFDVRVLEYDGLQLVTAKEAEFSYLFQCIR